MKNRIESSRAESPSLEIQELSNVQLLDKAALNTLPSPFQERWLVRIEQTILWSYDADFGADKEPRRKVFYRKPLLTRQGKLDKERLILEIFLHQPRLSR